MKIPTLDFHLCPIRLRPARGGPLFTKFASQTKTYTSDYDFDDESFNIKEGKETERDETTQDNVLFKVDE